MSRLTAIMRREGGAVEDAGAVGPRVRVDQAQDDHHTEHGARAFGREARPADPGDTEAECVHEEKAQGHVEAVEDGLQQQPVAGAPGADQPTEDDVIGEREGRRQHAHLPIGAGRGVHRLAAADERQRDGDDRLAQDEHRGADDDGKQQGAIGGGADLVAVVGAERLGDQPGRARAQEVEGGEDEIEDQRADRDAANQRRIAQLADDAEIDHADQRRRQIGERHRHGDRQNAAMRDLEGPDCALIDRHVEKPPEEAGLSIAARCSPVEQFLAGQTPRR